MEIDDVANFVGVEFFNNAIMQLCNLKALTFKVKSKEQNERSIEFNFDTIDKRIVFYYDQYEEVQTTTEKIDASGGLSHKGPYYLTFAELQGLEAKFSSPAFLSTVKTTLTVTTMPIITWAAGLTGGSLAASLIVPGTICGAYTAMGWGLFYVAPVTAILGFPLGFYMAYKMQKDDYDDQLYYLLGMINSRIIFQEEFDLDIDDVLYLDW